MSTTSTPPELDILLKYIKEHPEIAQDLYEDLCLGESMKQVDNDANTVVATIKNRDDVKAYFNSLHAI